MDRISLVIAAACGATAAAQSPDARAIVQAAAEAMQSVQTATYEAQLEVRGPTAWRVVIGRVQLAGLDHSDAIGARLAVRGEITRSRALAPERFEAAYDGQWMRQLRPGKQVLLEAQLGWGGEELLRGGFGDLVIFDLVSPEPLAAERGALELSWSGSAQVDGVSCDIVEARLGDGERRVEWWLGVEDRLPRQWRRSFRSARGDEVVSQLALRNLQVNIDIDPAAFRIEAPDDFKVELVGKEPPPEVKMGGVVPDLTVTGTDGKRHRLSDYRGQTVILAFWASWCPHSTRSLAALQRIHETYDGRGAALLALNCRERSGVDPIKLVREQGFTFFVADGNRAAIEYRVGDLPVFYVIDPQGRLVHRRSGFNEERRQQLVEVIE
ncbi:MAG: peroxiredoxin family protein, partial [Planctomycetota bacterium]